MVDVMGMDMNGYERVILGVIVLMVVEVGAEVSVTLYIHPNTDNTDGSAIYPRAASGGRRHGVPVNLSAHAVHQRGVDRQATRTTYN